MKRTTIFILAFLIFFSIIIINIIGKENYIKNPDKITASNEKIEVNNLVSENKYQYPEFYRGIYLNYWSGKDFNKLKNFVKMARKSHINAMVIDIQPAPNNICNIPAAHIKYLSSNNIHSIARLVCFDQGLKRWPVSKNKIHNIMELAESACKTGFKEIQLDYIRFHDSRSLRKLSLKQKYKFITGLLKKMNNRIKKYNVKIAADVFGRIPLNKRDIIGQNIEVFDSVVDYICPMAYPSHYTWSQKMQKDPYYTVHLTSKRARMRTKNAEIVSWIQAFKMRVKKSGLSYRKYIEEQIRATHDSKIRGFLLWNARQEYKIPLQAVNNYYQKNKDDL